MQTIDLLDDPRLKEVDVSNTILGSLDLSARNDLEVSATLETDLMDMDLSTCRKLKRLYLNKALRRKIELDKTPELKKRGAISLW